MTDFDLQKAQDLKNEIEKIKEGVSFFTPETNKESCPRFLKRKMQQRFPFVFRLHKKDGTKFECQCDIKGCFSGFLEVDNEFVDYCRKYFEEKLEKAEAEFANFETTSANDKEDV